MILLTSHFSLLTFAGTLFGHQFALREPRILLVAALLGALAVALWLWRGRDRLPWPAVVVRLLALLAFATALAQPSLARPAPAGATVFVVDRSRSMGQERLRSVEAQLAAAVAADTGREPLGLVAFAERATVVYPVGAVPASPDLLSAALERADVGSADYTDLAGALRLAEALPVGGAKHLVVLSDGRETLGQATEWAAGARARGVVVDALAPDGRPWAADVRLADLTVPESTWQGDDVEIGAAVTSDAAGPATVRLSVDGRAAGQQAVTLKAGANSFRFSLAPLSPGYHALRADVAPGSADAVAENNWLAATTVVRDKPRVLVIEGQQGNGAGLARALQRASSDVTVRAPATLTDRLSDLAPFDAVVLVDVPADALGFERQKALQEYVRSLGKGLVVTGGMNSFGKGNYEGSALEEALPLRVKPRAEGKRAPVALLLIVDRSYSMNFPNPGPTRIDMAKSAAAGAVRALSPGDEVAVLAFGDDNEWVSHLRTLAGPDDVNAVVDQISRLKADGETQMYAALRAGIDELNQSKAATKHIILFSDGEPTRSFDVDELTGRVRAAGMTLSTIAIGEGAATSLMEKLAKGGNGRYSFARRPDEIPRLTLEETEQLSGKTLATGNFRAIQTAPSPILRGLDPATLPTLDGYQITEAKPDAQQVLASGRDEPILAEWQYGVGRVVAWTSDLGGDLAPQWKDAAQFGQFWNQAVRWSLPAATSRSFRVRAEPEGRGVLVSVDAFDQDGAPVNLADTRAALRTPGGAEVQLALVQAAPGRYEVHLARADPGAYRLELRQGRGGGPVVDLAGFEVPYPAELRDTAVDGAALAGLTEQTGGRVVADGPALFQQRREARSPRYDPVWPWFVALGLGLFLIDIALRLGHAAAPAVRLRRLLPR